MRLLTDSTLVAVVTSRPALIAAAHRRRLADTVEAGDISFSPQALDALRTLAREHQVVVYVGAGQVRAARWFRDEGFTVGAYPFQSLTADAGRVSLPEHRAIDMPGALRVPALGLHELEGM